ncbi:HTH domain-containing protein [Mediterraneibacter gnavus]|uniref:HTH domain-containing protein n=1 Tax=Mediterraneibacter gnavus TaxID=33038 RepID=UPI0034A573C7
MMTKERNYVTANELAETLGVSTGQAYKIIRRLNNELDKKGFITVSGKCPRRYLEEKWYGYGK